MTTTRDPRLRTALGGALAALLLLALTACGSGSGGADPADDPITSIEYAQYQSTPDFDSTPRTTTDPARIASLDALLDEYDIGTVFDAATVDDAPGCPGARSTSVTATRASGAIVILVGGTGACEWSDVETELDGLVAGWRAEDA